MQGLYGEDRKGSTGEPVSALLGSHLKSGALAISGEKSKQPLHCGSTMVGNTVESLVEGGAAVLGRPSPCSCAAASMGRGPGRKMLESTGIGPQSQAGVWGSSCVVGLRLGGLCGPSALQVCQSNFTDQPPCH